MTKKTQKGAGSRRKSTCEEKEQKTQTTASGNKKKRQYSYDIVPVDYGEDDYTVWFW